MKRLADIQLAENDRKAIESAAAVLRRSFAVARVILFGSKARGDSRVDSDIDLLVVTRGPATDDEKQRMTDALFDIELDLGVVISKLVVPLDEWENGVYRVLPIKAAVDAEGVAA